jgi:hypothetical protein
LQLVDKLDLPLSPVDIKRQFEKSNNGNEAQRIKITMSAFVLPGHLYRHAFLDKSDAVIVCGWFPTELIYKRTRIHGQELKIGYIKGGLPPIPFASLLPLHHTTHLACLNRHCY